MKILIIVLFFLSTGTALHAQLILSDKQMQTLVTSYEDTSFGDDVVIKKGYRYISVTYTKSRSSDLEVYYTLVDLKSREVIQFTLTKGKKWKYCYSPNSSTGGYSTQLVVSGEVKNLSERKSDKYYSACRIVIIGTINKLYFSNEAAKKSFEATQ